MIRDKETGARSLRKVVDKVEMKLNSEYKSTDNLVNESMHKGEVQEYTGALIQNNDHYEIAVFQEGTQED